MNIINDFSSYIWTIALKTKAEVGRALQVWHKVVENQSNKWLKILVTDNGELLFNNIIKWCMDYSVEHHLTVPYC